MTTVNNTGSSAGMNSLMKTMNPQAAAAATADSVGAQTDKFMTLLVTQLKNQDPLNPMDNAELSCPPSPASTSSTTR
jgi:flagellar basal-body rod modification protein FlgD